MPAEITMPQLSDTMTEGAVVKWNKKEGDKVRAGEAIAEVETDKATMEMEAFEGGVLAHIITHEGEKAQVGSAIAVLAVGKEDPAAVKARYAGGQSAKSAEKNSAPIEKKPEHNAAPAEITMRSPGQSNSAANAREQASRGRVPPSTSAPVMDIEADQEAAGNGGAMRASDRPRANSVSSATATPARAVQHGENGRNGGRIFASPLARRIAADKGIDLAELTGTGPNGRIVQKDVLAFSPSAKPAATERASEAPAPAAKEVVPMSKMRTAIAAALQRSKQQIPHFYETIDIDVEDLSALRGRVNDQLAAQKIKLSLADYIHKAVCAALLRHPNVNATFDEKKNEITRHAGVNLGIAVAVPDGLIVPVLRGADKLGLKDIRQRSAELIDRARAQRLKQDEMTGGTFTVSSLGTFGVREFSAIINPPQVAILAVGAAEPRAMVRDGKIVPRTMMTVTLSADHRVVDGATAAEFLRTFKGMLEEPGMMLV